MEGYFLMVGKIPKYKALLLKILGDKRRPRSEDMSFLKSNMRHLHISCRNLNLKGLRCGGVVRSRWPKA
jgi:hypothetical protein